MVVEELPSSPIFMMYRMSAQLETDSAIGMPSMYLRREGPWHIWFGRYSGVRCILNGSNWEEQSEYITTDSVQRSPYMKQRH